MYSVEGAADRMARQARGAAGVAQGGLVPETTKSSPCCSFLRILPICTTYPLSVRETARNTMDKTHSIGIQG
jgi:hypothetical protein